MEIDNEFKDLIPPLTPEEYTGLEQSIINEGCRESIIIWKGIIVDGHNRYEICKKHGINFNVTEKNFDDKTSAKIWIVRNQFCRRNISIYQRSELAIELEGFFREKAKENQSSGGGDKKSKDVKSGCQNSDKAILPIDTKKELAKIAGVSHDTIAKVKTIREKAKPEIVEKVRKNEMSVNEAYTSIKRQEKEDKRQGQVRHNETIIKNNPTPLPNQKYKSILIDPPWDWGDEGDINQLGRAKPTYQTMSFEQILNLPISELSEDNAHIYLWITNRSLPKGFALLEKWGFRYVTTITWGKPSFGMGNYFRGQTEHLLFGVKGSLPLLRKDVGTLLLAGRGEKHSSKPDESYRLIESCSPGAWLEMFARSKRNGWASWGGEIV